MMKFIKEKILKVDRTDEEFLRLDTEYNNLTSILLGIVFLIISSGEMLVGYFINHTSAAGFIVISPYYILDFVVSAIAIMALMMLRESKMTRHWLSDAVSIGLVVVIFVVCQIASHVDVQATDVKNINIIVLAMFCSVFFVHFRLGVTLALNIGATVSTIVVLFFERTMISNFYPSLIDSIATGIVVLISACLYWKSRYQSYAQQQEYRVLASNDALTKILNRRGFDDRFEIAWADAMKQDTPLSLLIADIDHFKRYNDTYGHNEGDKCLAAVAEVLQASTRDDDVVARYGGEEFAVILSNTDAETSKIIADRIFENIKNKGIPHGDSVMPYVTISIGCMMCRPAEGSTKKHDLIVMADQALYMAKEQGRNRFIIHPESL
ncbi:hypothetical protein FACS189492_2300 [Clostridia bacterium]|nr:hypothetical protein FACS189492_2300 [Clostridia bacterium]